MIRQSRYSTKSRVLETAHPRAVLFLSHSPSRSSSRYPEGSLFPKLFLGGSTPMPWDACLFGREQHYQTLRHAWPAPTWPTKGMANSTGCARCLGTLL